MIIIVSGTAGSGKTTLVNAISKEFKLRKINVGAKFRELAKKLGYSKEGKPFLDFRKYALKHPEIDKEIDKLIINELKKDNCVVDSHLMAHYFKGKAYRINLKINKDIAAKRISLREDLPYDVALKLVSERNKKDIKLYQELYNININDLSVYDLVFNTSYFNIKDMNDVVINILHKLLKTKRI